MQPLGVGLVYLPELDALFREPNPDLSVLEFEPSTLWDKHTDAFGTVLHYRTNQEIFDRVAGFRQRKLVHSVGFPIGGSVAADDAYVAPLIDAAVSLEAAWISEHLSFNAFSAADKTEQTGFLLPPRQTDGGVKVAAQNIRRLAARLPAPFAFETSVNYLKPRSDEMPDGEFFAAIAEEADCGIVLDLHNLWANERNGRQPIAEVLAAMPLDRVWEVHLAGGMMLGGYYLDSHSDVIPQELFAIACDIIPRLPNLGALLFEILSGFLPQLGIDAVRRQLPQLSELWKLRSAQRVTVATRSLPTRLSDSYADDVALWERELGSLSIGRTLHDGGHFQLGNDGAVSVLRTLNSEFRSGRIARALRFTMTLLLGTLGRDAVRQLLAEYEHSICPDVFTSGEADRFACFLREKKSRLPPVSFLDQVLNFEHALIRAALYGASSRIDWECDANELFKLLDAGVIPQTIRPAMFSMQIVPEDRLDDR